jgi:hypothetical protein
VHSTGFIHMLVAQNPKNPRSKSYKRFNLYREGMHTRDFLNVGGLPIDLGWDVQKHQVWGSSERSRFIEILPEVTPARDRMRDYLFYWRPSTPRGGLLDHIASGQLARVSKGDHLWVVTVAGKKLILFGKMTVDAIVSQRAAERRLKGRKDLWKADYHAVTKDGTAQAMGNIDLTERALELRFQGTKDRLPADFTGSNLQTMRLLTAPSADLLEEIWRNATGDIPDLRDLAQEADDLEQHDSFDPENTSDGRIRILREIANRQGQPAFRNRVLDAYDRRCAITDWSVVETLEAAHIYPYRGAHTNAISNGILLRADVHTLFDLGFIAIDTSDYTVLVADRLKDSPYGCFSGRKFRRPLSTRVHPSKQALDKHRKLFGL